MSVRNILDFNGKIQQQYLPATIMVQAPAPGLDARVLMDAGTYSGGISLLGADSGSPGTFIARSGGNNGAVGKAVIQGNPDGNVSMGDATNTGTGNLTLLGASGPSTVFNRLYDPVFTRIRSDNTSTLINDRVGTGFDIPNIGLYQLYVNITTGSGLSIPANSYFTFGIYDADAGGGSGAYIWKQTVKASDLIGPDSRTQATQFQFGGVPKYLIPKGKDGYALGWQSSNGAGGVATWNLGAGGELNLELYSCG